MNFQDMTFKNILLLATSIVIILVFFSFEIDREYAENINILELEAN